MSITATIQQFTQTISESLEQETFIKISLGNYQGADSALKNIYVRSVIIKREQKLAFTFRNKTNDIVKNYSVHEGIALLADYLQQGFMVATLFTTEKDVLFENRKNSKAILKESKASSKEKPSQEHNREKKRLIKPNDKAYLYELKITDEAGNVFKNAQDKYKQINHFVELLSSLIKEANDERPLKKVVDMGSGKGYLTFALYDYLHSVLGLDTAVTGVEYRQDLVSLCNEIAQKSGFDALNFVQGTIQDYDCDTIDLLIALHACDTATDDAIYKGIKGDAKLIVVAPCCHKQIRRELEKTKVKNEVSFLTKYGIFLERQAEMVTDGIRALILEYFGYKTNVFQFISDAHTPKNVLVVGIKGTTSPQRQAEIRAKIAETKAFFGIGYHHLERLFELEAV
ncbi:MAG: SAM-dependent methyltransferase [Flectobacillus sp.]|nr:SAM-dependent methyltransferase [Flectobacillus sp.]